jgi:GNAT superfamily N-acetyltransferase
VDIHYREATADDGETFGLLRWAMQSERHPEQSPTGEQVAEYYAAFGAYIRNGIIRRTMRGWLAEADGQAVGSAILLIWQMPPIMTDPLRKRGYVSSVYIAPQVRRQGIGRHLMGLLIAAAREEGIHRVILNTSDMGRPLYEGLGFTPPMRGMELTILPSDDHAR